MAPARPPARASAGTRFGRDRHGCDHLLAQPDDCRTDFCPDTDRHQDLRRVAGAPRWPGLVGNFERPRPNPQRPLDVLLQAFSIARNERFARESADTYDGVEVIVLPGVDPGPIKRNDFSKTEALIARAHAASAGFLDAHPAAASL